jgi:indolepyruvate ferredoxin oxidoreductase beta subunit
MDKDIMLAGVGGQGILSIAYCICNAALKRGLNFKQAEVHGMAQRGGAVESHLRLSADRISSDLVSRGRADVVLGVEPLEALRRAPYLSPTGILVSSSTPVVNIPDYPELDDLLRRIGTFENHILVDSQAVAKTAGTARADNMVMLGAAAPALGFAVDAFDEFVAELFGRKSARMVGINCRAVRLGRLAAERYCEYRAAGSDPPSALRRVGELDLTALVEAGSAVANPPVRSRR